MEFYSTYLTYSVEQGCSYKSQLWLISLAEREIWGNPEYAVKQKNALKLFLWLHPWLSASLNSHCFCYCLMFRKEKGTTMDLWQQVLIETKNKSKMHLGLSENVSNNVVNRFMIISDDCQRVAKKVTIYFLIYFDIDILVTYQMQ